MEVAITDLKMYLDRSEHNIAKNVLFRPAYRTTITV